MAARTQRQEESFRCTAQISAIPTLRRNTALALAVALAVGACNAAASMGSIDIVTRPDGGTLPVYGKDSRKWVVGAPGQEYGIRVCNRTGERVLAVMSVDGVNIVSGETASPSQSGYVLSAYECADINGWRKSQSSTAAFYFTELPDAYAARTGRPDNVGVIGVAFFRERQERISFRESPPLARAMPAQRQDAAAASASTAEGRASNDAMSRKEVEADRSTPPAAPAPLGKIGTGYGRHEQSYVQTTSFVRESARPNLTLAINYDRRENLIAMGILPPPAIARNVNPFPAWTPRFVPDPPTR